MWTTGVTALQLKDQAVLEIEFVDVRLVYDQRRTQNDFAASQFKSAEASGVDGLHTAWNLVLREQ